MKVAIVGVGGVGGVFAALLTRAGVDVALVARGRILEALKSDGLQVSSSLGELSVRSVAAAADPSSLGRADVVVVAVKAWQVSEIAPRLLPLLKPDSVVIPVQNGVEAADQLQAVLPAGAVVGGICHVQAWIDRPGHVTHVGIPPLVTLGELSGKVSPRLEHIAEALKAAGMTVVLSSNIRADLWEKLLFVEPLGSVGAVTRVPVDVLRSVPESRAMLVEAMQEVSRVAASLGIQVHPEAVDRSMKRVDSLPAGSTASLQRDIADGRPSELEEQTGAVVRFAQRTRTAAPLHAYLRSALLPQELLARQKQPAATSRDRG